MNQRSFLPARLIVALTLSSLSGVAGCADDSAQGSNPGGSPDGANSESSFTCCINGLRHVCPDEAAFEACAGFDMGACMSECDGDPTCADACFDQQAQSTPDPSACVEDPEGDCGDDGGTPPGSSGGGAGDASSGSGSGSDCVDASAFCESDYDCCSTVCTNGFCQEAEGTCLGDGGFCDTGLDCCSVVCDGGFCVGN